MIRIKPSGSGRIIPALVRRLDARRIAVDAVLLDKKRRHGNRSARIEFGTNQVGGVDPKTLEFHEYRLPDPGARPRRIAITGDDFVWYSDYARLSRPARNRDRQGNGMAIAERAEVRALRHLGDLRRHLVQRVRFDPQHGGFLLANSLVNGVTLVTIEK